MLSGFTSSFTQLTLKVVQFPHVFDLDFMELTFVHNVCISTYEERGKDYQASSALIQRSLHWINVDGWMGD